MSESMPDPIPATDAAKVAAVRRAIALVQLGDRDDPEAYAMALAEAVESPAAAVWGLQKLVWVLLAGTLGLAQFERLELLDGVQIDVATLEFGG